MPGMTGSIRAEAMVGRDDRRDEEHRGKRRYAGRGLPEEPPEATPMSAAAVRYSDATATACSTPGSVSAIAVPPRPRPTG